MGKRDSQLVWQVTAGSQGLLSRDELQSALPRHEHLSVIVQ